MKIGYIFFISIILITVFSCTKKDEPDFSDQSYFPIIEGNYYVYSVEEVNYTLQGQESLSYELKEVIADTLIFFDQVKYRVERFTRANSSAPWPEQPDSVWTVYKDNFKAVKTENNVNYIKMVFPSHENTTWDGNGLNVYDKDDYVLKNTDKSYVLNDQMYNPTISVIQSDQESLIDKDYRIEVYSKDIGLICKEIQVYEYDEEFIGQDTTVIEFGRKLVQKLTSCGKI